MFKFISTLLSLWVLSACGTIPEIVLNEALPTVAVEPSNPVLKQISEGTFQNGFHKVSGQASLIENGDQKFLRVENFSTENGPDLFFYLIRNDSGLPQAGDFINLGRLKATQGTANYEIPADINLEDYQSVSVWCQAFSVNFGSARLALQ